MRQQGRDGGHGEGGGEHTGLAAPRRLARLHATELMDSPAEASFDRWTRLASAWLNASTSTITLIDADRAFFKSAVGLPECLLPTRQAPLSHSICKHVVQRGAPLVFADGREHPLVRDNGAVHAYGLTAYAGMPLTLGSGEVLGVLCVAEGRPRAWTKAELAALRDLAAAVTTELELRLALAAKQDLLAAVTHDLKAPLTAMRLSVAMAGRHLGRTAPPVRRAVERIDGAAHRMEALVYQILDGGSEAGGAAQVTPTTVPLSTLVHAALESVRVMADERRVALAAADCPPDASIVCDPLRLGQALSNLAHNAVEHTPPGSAVTVRCALDEERAAIAVEDQGEGVPPHERARLFRRGARGRGIKRRGHGLGLTIAETYVRAHRGTIAVEGRDDGPGARFVITVPRRGPASPPRL